MAAHHEVVSHMKVHPKYLESKATSHTWALGAFAELIDNAFDAKAKEIHIDHLTIHKFNCLSFQDDGLGMEANHLHDMLSLGYSQFHDRHHVGKYGSGFKSGSMRLGNDVIVFTRTKDSAGIGLLSQTYLRDIKADNVLVPMLHYKLPGFREHGQDTNLRAILKHSPFKQEKELINKLKEFSGTGTLIIIYNLRKGEKNDRAELDFTTDPDDIRWPNITGADLKKTISYRNSLRQYCSILYLCPRMKIKVRGKYVENKLVVKYLGNAIEDKYQPKGETKPFKITFGQVTGTDMSGEYGIMLYSGNRLIKPYEKVTCQKQNDGVGFGIVGVTDAEFLTPTENKQDFVRDAKFINAMTSYDKKLKSYWTKISETPPVSRAQTLKRKSVDATAGTSGKQTKLSSQDMCSSGKASTSSSSTQGHTRLRISHQVILSPNHAGGAGKHKSAGKYKSAGRDSLARGVNNDVSDTYARGNYPNDHHSPSQGGESEPIEDAPQINGSKHVHNNQVGVAEASESENVMERPSQQTTATTTTIEKIKAKHIRDIAGMQRKLLAKDTEIKNLQTELKTCYSSVLQLLKRLKPDEEIDDSADFQSLVDMLAEVIDE